MAIKLRKYRLALLVLILLCIIFPSLAFSYTNIEMSNISLKKTKTERLLIEWDTNIKTSGNVVYGKNRNALSHREYGDRTFGTKHAIEISDLEEGELYYFQLVSKNSVKVVRSKIFERYIDVRCQFTPHPPHVTGLEVDNFSKKSTGSQGTVSFETNFPSTGTLTVKRNNKLIEVVDLAHSTDHSATITGLEPSVCYDLYLNLNSKYSYGYSGNYSLCTLRKRVLPASSSGNWTYVFDDAPEGHVTDSGVIVAGIDYERFPKIQAFYKTSDSPKIWLIANNQRHLITSPRAFEDYGFSWGDVETVSWPQIVKYDMVRLVKAPGSDIIYFLHGRADGTIAKIVIPSVDVFDSYPDNRREDIVVISQYDIDMYENVSLVRNMSNGYLYYVSGNVKHYIAKDIASRYIFDYDEVLSVNTIHLSRYETGDGLK